MLKNIVYFLVFCFFSSVVIAYFSFWQVIIPPQGWQKEGEIIFSIKKGDNLFSISDNLKKSGLIKNTTLFQAYILLTGDYSCLQSGTYLFNKPITIKQISRKIISGDTFKVRITIQEGLDIQDIEEKLNKYLDNTGQDIQLSQIKASSYKDRYQFLKDIPVDSSLEGFLFPDTYFFEPETQGQKVIKTFLENFNKKLTSELREEIKFQGKTIFDIVTMASLIEKEVRTIEDKKIVSGILWKRIANNMPVQIDATISYILKIRGIRSQKDGSVSIAQTKIDSLYNTYKYKGLPIGPICSPGLSSIKAAIYPKKSDFWYYLSTPDGKTIFSQNLREHNLAKEKYLD